MGFFPSYSVYLSSANNKTCLDLYECVYPTVYNRCCYHLALWTLLTVAYALSQSISYFLPTRNGFGKWSSLTQLYMNIVNSISENTGTLLGAQSHIIRYQISD